MTQEQRNEDRISALEKGQQQILEILKPISETYITASRLGKWGMGLLVFISISIGVILGFKNLVK
jgi:hypothetical protein